MSPTLEIFAWIVGGIVIFYVFYRLGRDHAK